MDEPCHLAAGCLELALSLDMDAIGGDAAWVIICLVIGA
jgi:hypothetical protein